MYNCRRRCAKYYIKGERKGWVDKFIEDLPGMPDNIKYDGEGHYWIGFATVRNSVLLIISYTTHMFFFLILYLYMDYYYYYAYIFLLNFIFIYGLVGGYERRKQRGFGTQHSNILQYERFQQWWRGTWGCHPWRKMEGSWLWIWKENRSPTTMTPNCHWCRLGSRSESTCTVVLLLDPSFSALILTAMLQLPPPRPPPCF